jgi:hypothetical protein
MTGQAQGTPVPNAPVPFPPVPFPPGQTPADLAALESQLGEFRVQLNGLQAQWDGLHSQLDAMLRNNPARPGVQQQWADVGVQMAQVRGEIARLEARIAQKQGLPVAGTSVPPGPPPRSIDPNRPVVPAVTALFIVLAFPVSVAWARRIFRGRPQQAPVPLEQTVRLERIEQAVEAVAIEVERIAEGQRFVTRILAERPQRSPVEESVGGPLSAAVPPLALGAGPIETIRVPERERVRQSITPH